MINGRKIPTYREVIAEQLYESYCRAVGGVAFNGDALPEWDEFRADSSKQKQSDAWLATADCAIDRLKLNWP